MSVEIMRNTRVMTPAGAGTVGAVISLVNGQRRYIVRLDGKASRQFLPDQLQRLEEAA